MNKNGYNKEPRIYLWQYLWEEKGEENRAGNELQHLETVLLTKASYKPGGIQDVGMISVMI